MAVAVIEEAGGRGKASGPLAPPAAPCGALFVC